MRHVRPLKSQSISSAVSFIERAATASFKCSGFDAPDDGGHHTLLDRSQASAICARGTPLALAMALT